MYRSNSKVKHTLHIIHDNDFADTTDIKFFALVVSLAKYALSCLLYDLCSTFYFFPCQLNIQCHSDAGKQIRNCG